MQKELIIEIGFEELPAIPLLKELKNIPSKFKNAFKEFRLEFTFDFFYTPRRFIFHSKNFPLFQQNQTVKLFGPPLDVAYKDGLPTPAAIGFAKRCNVELDSLARAQKDGREVLYFTYEQKGESSQRFIADALYKFLTSLNFGRSMRWGDRSEGFIRPIKWLFCMMDDRVLEISLMDVFSSNYTLGHMSHLGKRVRIESGAEFFEKLRANKVIYSQEERKNRVLTQIKEIEQKNAIEVDIDSDLLDEVVAITEYPNALLGSIDSAFLRLPKEVIATSMKEHQRYFACYKGGNIAPNFIVVSNGDCEDFSLVVAGNERVLKARLNDALFFWDNDLREGLQPERLKDVIFVRGFGSLYDKSKREQTIANLLLEGLSEEFWKEFGSDFTDAKSVLNEAIIYSKADLLTEMVYEFTELQGIMGGYYALESGMDKKIALALQEQYLPTSQSSRLPTSNLGSLLALSNKLDTIFSMFSLGFIPSGNKDPYALRRAALGVLRIVANKGIPLNIQELIEVVGESYPRIDKNAVESFVHERIFALYDINPSIINAAISSKERDIYELVLKIEALNEIVNKEGFSENFSTFKRVANISRDIELDTKLPIDSSLFEKDEERELFNAYELAKHNLSGGYKERLRRLFELKPYIDLFFDNVMVNVEDEKIRNNRKNLVGSIYKSIKEIADIKEITI